MLLGLYRQGMKYKALIKLLRGLIALKRVFWWFGPPLHFILAKLFGGVWRVFAFFHYKIEYFFKRTGWGKDRAWWLKRDNLQLILLAVLFIAALPQTKLFAKQSDYLPGQKTMAYKLFGPGEQYGAEELSAEPTVTAPTVTPLWRSGSIESGSTLGSGSEQVMEHELGTVAFGGTAVSKPSIIPGATIVSNERRNVVEYVIEPGDSLSSVAYRYGVSVATILWENNLGVRSLIRPGDKIRIPPTTGVMHTIKKGDTLKKIATLYGAKAEEIVSFNKLKEDGTDLVIGEKIMVPNGVKAEQIAVSRVPSSYSSYSKIAAPASSRQSPSLSGYVWPSAAKTITQYYSWRHYGLDIAGKFQSANYAAKAGKVEIAQCGWNRGYGCYILINHGGGVKTLYGHNSRLLVSPGDYVTTGQTIGLMGNTGNVRGVTGIHLHFEVQVNGAKMNPLKYVR
ncbi:MAG: M23 family metallopeptidase [Patescibacteria group bacterium]|nr:M23 family metallopeptidase [Patescibacteria group bacterium]